MRNSLLAVAILGGLAAAGCSKDPASIGSSRVAEVSGARTDGQALAPASRSASHIASLPDRGDLIRYDASAVALQQGAQTMRPVELSETRALRAISEGGMEIKAPDGHPIRVKYARHLEHPDGNWTWVGHPVGTNPGEDVILTFGENAVFGSIPDRNGVPLQLTTQGGRTWMVETDPSKLALADTPRESDQLTPPVSALAGNAVDLAAAATATTSSSHRIAAAQRAAADALSATAPATATVDLVLGYTVGFATRFGGASQALTRLNFLVDVANQAYINSQVHGQVRLVRAVQVDYPDATQNRGALYELSGVQCTNTSGPGQLHLPDRDVNCISTAAPAALQPLLDARERYHADAVSLVRTYQQVENQSCGVAWLLGGGQQPIDAGSAAFALSVVSDSGGTTGPTCRNETLAHELGHNMGLAHDRATAQGSDDTNSDNDPLDPEEYGRFAYSFGYKTGADAGNFYTIMSVPNAGQKAYGVFSNPRITACGGLACGVTDQADNALTLDQTMPIVAAFRVARVPMDFNADGRSDILWRNSGTGSNAIWKSGDIASQQSVSAVTNLSWAVVKGGDFNGDGAGDILWRNSRTGANAIWKSGNSATPQSIASVTNLQWKIVGSGDFDGDGRSDIFWRNTATGANAIWKSGNGATPMSVTAVTNLAFSVAGVGDFDNDGVDDILWRNSITGANAIWRSAKSSTPQSTTAVANLQWKIAGVGDFNADGHADVLWHNASTGVNVIWKSGNSATPQAVATVTNMAWDIAGVGDFNGDGFADILWRNSASGANAIWLSGNFNTQQSVSAVTNTAWKVMP